MMNLIQMEGGVVPSIVRSDHKARYIKALREAQEEEVSDGFLLFMTDELLDDLQRTNDEFVASLARDVPWSGDCSDGFSSTPTPQVIPQVTRFVVTLGTQRLSASELRRRLGLSDAKSFRGLYLRPAIDAGLAQITIPERPRSRNQQYVLTPKGLAMLRKLENRHLPYLCAVTRECAHGGVFPLDTIVAKATGAGAWYDGSHQRMKGRHPWYASSASASRSSRTCA